MKDPLYLVINADDFGKSPSVNDAIESAHRLGLLNSASIMAGGKAFDEAAQLAGELPGLSVGLHVTLCDGRAVLPHSEVPGLADGGGSFEKNPAKAGFKYWTQRKALSGQIEAEIEAQFDRLQAAGITPAHVDSHHHLHAHPVIFNILRKAALKRGVEWMRMPPGPFDGFGFFSFYAIPRMHEWMALKAMELFNARLFNGMPARSRGFFQKSPNTYGFSRTGHFCGDYLAGLIPRLRGPVAEVFLHPDRATPGGTREMEAVISESAKIKKLADSRGIILAGFKDVKIMQKGLS